MIKISSDLVISFETNEIITLIENNGNSITKVEPRIMHVLQILIDNSPNVVSREQLISEVWADYGGADDALNQAISHLRKLLNDTNKENRLIDTVVKKGYRFIGKNEMLSDSATNYNLKEQKSMIWILIVTGVLILVVFAIYFLTSKDSIAPAAPLDKSPNKSTKAPVHR